MEFYMYMKGTLKTYEHMESFMYTREDTFIKTYEYMESFTLYIREDTFIKLINIWKVLPCI
jgi:hypothetical protein